MHLIRQKHNSTGCQWEYINKLRHEGIIQSPEDIQTGGYYLYKEKHGMVALVKVIKKSSCNGWDSFTLVVKRVLFSPWEVRRGTVFEVGLDLTYTSYPGSWWFEVGMSIIKSSLPPIIPLAESKKPYFIEIGQEPVNDTAL